MLWQTLQHTATLCRTLPHTAAHCNALQHTTAHCNTLQHTATHFNTLQHTAIHRNTLQHTAPHREGDALTHSATHHRRRRSDLKKVRQPKFQLQHTATHCTILQHTATPVHQKDAPFACPSRRCAGVSYRTECVAVCCSVKKYWNKKYWLSYFCVAVCCSVLQCAVVCCSVKVRQPKFQQVFTGFFVTFKQVVTGFPKISIKQVFTGVIRGPLII